MSKDKSEVPALAGYPQHPKYPYGVFSVGDRAHIAGYSDIHPCTVVKVQRKGREVVVRQDQAKLADGQVPEILPGGFAGHCVNQRDLVYDISECLDGALRIFTLRKWRGRYVWTEKGETPDGTMCLRHGWRYFYDYNF